MQQRFCLKLFLALIIQLCFVSCFDKKKEKQIKKSETEYIIWSQKWFPDNSARLKSAVVIDDKGTLITVGQNFTSTDSIDQPTTIAKISSDGRMLENKSVGKTGSYKGKYNKNRPYNEFNENRLLEIIKTNDKRILLFGYKTFPGFAKKLWMLEIDSNLNILKDTVYMNLGVSDIAKMKAFNTSKGWCLVTGNYFEEKGLARYRIPVYEFTNDYACIETKPYLKVDTKEGVLQMQYVNGVVEHEDGLLLCGKAALNPNKINDDDLKLKGYIFQYDKKSKQSKVVLQSEENMFPISVKFSGGQYGVLYKFYDKEDKNNVKNYNVVVSYDSKFKELWRNKQLVGKGDTPGYITFYNKNWHVYGACFKSGFMVLYELVYDKNGKLLDTKYSQNSLETDAVGDIYFNNQIFRLSTDNGWKIDKIGFTN